MRLHALTVAVCVWLTFAAGAAAAAPSLVWSAASGCPDRDSVQRAIAQGADPQAQSLVRAVRAEVLANDDGYRMELELETADSTYRKRLTAEVCATFVELLLLELAFAALPGRVAVEPNAPEQEAKKIWGARLTGSVGSGPLPQPSAAIALVLAMSLRALRVELGAAYSLPREIRYADVKQVGARFDAISGELRGCYVLSLRRIELPFCAGAELGSLHGRGLRTEKNFSVFRLWAALFLAPVLHFPIARLVSGWAELAGALVVHRPRYGVRNLPPLFQPDLLLVRGALGVAVRFN